MNDNRDAWVHSHNTMSVYNLSLRIENVSPYVDAEFIKKILETFHFGSVKKVFIREHIRFETNRRDRTAFVYFDGWYDTTYNRTRQDRMLNEKSSVTIHYDSTNQMELNLWNEEPLTPFSYDLHDDSFE